MYVKGSTMQIKYTHVITLLLTIISNCIFGAGNLIKITNNSSTDYTVAVHENRGKKLSFPIVSQQTWTGKLSFNNSIHITSQNKKRVFVVKTMPTYLAVTTFEEQRKVDDLRINLHDIFNNSIALMHKISLKKPDESFKRTEKNPWSITLTIDKKEQINLESFIFDETHQDDVLLKKAAIPGPLLKSYVVRVKP